MSFIFAGYFPKKIARRDVRLRAPVVREIWSVSECISKGPQGWIDRWSHNALWLYDTPERAEAVVPERERQDFRIVGYRIWSGCFEAGEEKDLSFSEEATAILDPSYVSLGFDAVVRGMDAFGCSPLSCNYGAESMATNEYCLFPSLDAAIVGAKEFSSGNWEPGTYWVVEVLSRRQ